MIKIAINGFGRIGRPVFRRILDFHPTLKVVAINDLTDRRTLAHLLEHDSIYGHYPRAQKAMQGVKLFSEKDPVSLPWKKLGIDIVLECTGIFSKYDDAKKHIEAGAKKVVISAPSKTPGKVPSYLLGVNAKKFNSKKDNIVDMGSCTTNCLAPVAKVLNDNFKIIKGFMTTAHSYTNDQRILDLPHKDLRRARAAALNIIPTSTGAAKTIGKIIPELEGKLDGIALRVPTPTVSVLDLTCEIQKRASVKEINSSFIKASKQKELKGILAVESVPLVSSDFIGNTHSAIVDLENTKVQDNLVKVLAWYDNEYSYSCRLAEMADYIGKRLK